MKSYSRTVCIIFRQSLEDFLTNIHLTVVSVSSLLPIIPPCGTGFGSANRRRQVNMEERRQRRRQRTFGWGSRAITIIVAVVGLSGVGITSTLQIGRSGSL